VVSLPLHLPPLLLVVTLRGFKVYSVQSPWELCNLVFLGRRTKLEGVGELRSRSVVSYG